jgi:hypothetical protein
MTTTKIILEKENISVSYDARGATLPSFPPMRPLSGGRFAGHR